MEPKGSLLCSEEWVTGSLYPDEINPVHTFPTYFTKIHSIMLLYIYAMYPFLKRKNYLLASQTDDGCWQPHAFFAVPLCFSASVLGLYLTWKWFAAL